MPASKTRRRRRKTLKRHFRYSANDPSKSLREFAKYITKLSPVNRKGLGAAEARRQKMIAATYPIKTTWTKTKKEVVTIKYI